MHLAVIDLYQTSPAFWILAGLVAIYIAGRAVLDALIKPATASAARLAWAVALNVATLVALALAMDRPGIAVGMLFATSVAAMSLVAGLSAMIAPIPALPPASRRVWFFLLPIAILGLLAGLSGQLTLTHAAVLAMQGALILYVRSDPKVGADEDWATPVLLFDHTVPVPPHRPIWRRIELLLSVALLLIGGFFIIDAARSPASPIGHLPDAMLAVGVLGPITILPLVGISAAFAQRGRARAVAGAAVLLVIFNLCILLPAAIALWMVRPALVQLGGRAWPAVASLPASDPGPIAQFNSTMPFPMQLWRIDTIVLVILALAALPVALGRFSVGRREGIALVGLYAVYLIANAIVAMRY